MDHTDDDDEARGARDEARAPAGENAAASAPRCPVEFTVDVIGGKWKSTILRHLFFDGTQRFNELRRKIPAVTQQVLTAQLRELERDGVIARTVYAEVPPRVEYALTDFGRTLGPVLMAMMTWAEQHQAAVEAARRGAGRG